MADRLLHLGLTTEPTVVEGRHIGDCESKVFLQTRLLSHETGGLANSSATPQADSSAVATLLTFEFDSSLHASDGFFLS